MQETLFRQLEWKTVSNLNDFYAAHDEFNETRTALDNGKEHSACQSCWAYENSGIASMREQNLYYKETQNDPPVIDIRHVDLRLSNKCNLQCKMCHPGDSDQLVKLSLELTNKGISNPFSDILPKNKTEDTAKLMELILELPNLEAIRFAGGEPFIMPEVETFLYKLVELNKTDISIEFITNCTSAKPKIIELLEKFKHVDLMCSIDGVGDTLEYQRYPAKWETVENNFKRMYNSKCNTRIVPCIGLLNYLDLPRFMQWAEQFPKSLITYNEIQEPSFLDFRLIPISVRKEFYWKFAAYTLPPVRDGVFRVVPRWHNFQEELMYEYREPTEEECCQLYNYSKMWDYRCNEKFLDRYPWAEYMITRAIKGKGNDTGFNFRQEIQRRWSQIKWGRR
tara:strand:+ start:5276 stop:6457 length:1182 start_codon:yes stop_codon:yes gene_type:complete